jgi:hypothetical protein
MKKPLTSQRSRMQIELDRRGSGVAAILLSFNTLLALERKGTLTRLERTEVVEQSLAKLEGLDVSPSLYSQEAWQSARELLEQLRRDYPKTANEL